MLDELKHYLFMVKKKLRGRDDFEYLMIEISSIAINKTTNTRSFKNSYSKKGVI